MGRKTIKTKRIYGRPAGQQSTSRTVKTRGAHRGYPHQPACALKASEDPGFKDETKTLLQRLHFCSQNKRDVYLVSTHLL